MKYQIQSASVMTPIMVGEDPNTADESENQNVDYLASQGGAPSQFGGKQKSWPVDITTNIQKSDQQLSNAAKFLSEESPEETIRQDQRQQWSFAPKDRESDAVPDDDKLYYS